MAVPRLDSSIKHFGPKTSSFESKMILHALLQGMYLLHIAPFFGCSENTQSARSYFLHYLR